MRAAVDAPPPMTNPNPLPGALLMVWLQLAARILKVLQAVNA